jgi:hypothetical protein
MFCSNRNDTDTASTSVVSAGVHSKVQTKRIPRAASAQRIHYRKFGGSWRAVVFRHRASQIGQINWFRICASFEFQTRCHPAFLFMRATQESLLRCIKRSQIEQIFARGRVQFGKIA